MKNAIVTGGGSGIGLAIATKLVVSGVKTIIIGRDMDKLVKAQQQLGRNCHCISFDLSNTQNIPALVENIVAKHESIDILVNNAGINQIKDFEQVSDEEFARINAPALKTTTMW